MEIDLRLRGPSITEASDTGSRFWPKCVDARVDAASAVYISGSEMSICSASIRTFCLRNAHTAKGSASFRQGRVWRRPKRPRTGSGGRTRSQRTPSMMTLRPLARNAKRLGVRLRSLGAATKGAEWIEEFTMSLSGLTPQMNGEATERYQR